MDFKVGVRTQFTERPGTSLVGRIFSITAPAFLQRVQTGLGAGVSCLRFGALRGRKARLTLQGGSDGAEERSAWPEK